jgi:hypothetical protein
MERVNTHETQFQNFKLNSLNEMQVLQQQVEQLQNDKETLQKRVEILEDSTVILYCRR